MRGLLIQAIRSQICCLISRRISRYVLIDFRPDLGCVVRDFAIKLAVSNISANLFVVFLAYQLQNRLKSHEMHLF